MVVISDRVESSAGLDSSARLGLLGCARRRHRDPSRLLQLLTTLDGTTSKVSVVCHRVTDVSSCVPQSYRCVLLCATELQMCLILCETRCGVVRMVTSLQAGHSINCDSIPGRDQEISIFSYMSRCALGRMEGAFHGG